MIANRRNMSGCLDELHEAAVQRTGLQIFGNPSYLRGLRALLEAFDTDLELTGDSRRSAYELVLQSLVSRMYAQKGWAENQEAISVPIHRPIVITGLPRTGTTALHRLMSVDPKFQSLQFWLAETPMPRPACDLWEAHPAYQASAARLAKLYLQAPDLRKSHETFAGEAEECTVVLMQSFLTNFWAAAFDLPTYAQWMTSENEFESYRRYVAVLSLIGASEPEKCWLLKSPYHMVQIEQVLNVFPDACVVQTHRDPREAIPSLCNLAYLSRRNFLGATVRAETIGLAQCTFWREALDGMAARSRNSPAQFLDIEHQRLINDPLGAVFSIYDYFRMERPSHRTVQRMRAWIVTNSNRKYGTQTGSVDRWGINSTQICRLFADYRSQRLYG